jgi:arylsulfatase A-like enzyme
MRALPPGPPGSSLALLRSSLLPLLCAGWLAACGAAPRPPNVILISIDTLRRDALACFEPSAAALPALDLLAAMSVRFEHAYSSASWTLPSHASMLTGLYPDRHGATDRRVTLAEGVDTLAGALAARGYETAAFTGGGFLDAKYGLGRGFARYEAKTHSKQEPAETAEGLLARVGDYLGARANERPLFLFLHTYAVHNYYDARAEAAALSGRTGLGTRKQYVDCVLGRKPCEPGAWDDLGALYRAELQLMDQSFARLVSALEAAGLWRDAIVVLVSDHGEGFEPARGRIHHGGRLHADQLSVPLLVRGPLQESGPGFAPRAEAAPASLVDLMPTLLELTGARVPAGLDGRSLAASLRTGAAPAARPLLAMEHYFGWQDGKRDTSEEVLSLPRELAVIDAGGWYLTGEREDELYALDDAAQATNRADASRSAAARALLGERPLPRAESRPAEGDLHLEQALDALGYGGGD